MVGLDSRNVVLDYPASLGYKARGQAWLGGDVCASHLTVQSQWRRGINDGGWSTETSWTTAQAQSSGGKMEYVSGMVVNQGAKAAMGMSLRCVSPYAQGPDTRFNAPTSIRPITNTPTMNPGLTYSGSNVIASGSGFAGCAAGNTYQWTVTGSSYGTAASRTIGTIAAGSTFNATYGVRCATAYTTGPSRSYTRSVTRPVPAPSAPTSVRAGGQHACYTSSGIPSANVVIKFTGSPGASYHQAYVSFNNPNGSSSSSGIQTVSDGSIVVATPYSGNGGITLYVRAVNSSGVSSWTSATSQPGIGCGPGGGVVNP